MKVTGNVKGSLPPLGPSGTQIEVDPYEEDFNHAEQNLIMGNSEIMFKTQGSGNEYRINVQHMIEYQGCAADLSRMRRTLRFRSNKNYISYDNTDQV